MTEVQSKITVEVNGEEAARLTRIWKRKKEEAEKEYKHYAGVLSEHLEPGGPTRWGWKLSAWPTREEVDLNKMPEKLVGERSKLLEDIEDTERTLRVLRSELEAIDKPYITKVKNEKAKPRLLEDNKKE
jgi:hypothetical protein